MCSCTGNSCGCSTVTGRRGARGEQGLPGAAGPGARVIQGDGPPSTDPDPVSAYVLYEDTATDGHWWIWTPGSPGAWADTGVPVSGSDGADGKNAFTTLTVPFLAPAANGSTSWVITMADTSWMVEGEIIFIETAGYYSVTTIVTTTQAIVLNLRNDSTGVYQSNADPATVIPAGSRISPGGLQGPAGLPVQITSGAPDPTVTPTGGASGFYVQSGAGGTYWYFNGTTGGPWTDTGVSATGPAGATGSAGAAGHSPVITAVSSNPTGAGGSAGDIRIYQPPANNGFTTFYYNLAGTWTQGPTVLGSRLLGYSTSSATPNPWNLQANVSDYYWSYVAGHLIFSVCSVAGAPGTWVTAIDIPISGGGGAPVDAEYIVAVSNPTLSAERVATATATIVPDTVVPGQMRWNIPDDGVTNAKLNNVPSNTFKGLGLGGPANPIDLTANQASDILDTATDPFVRTSAIPGGTSTFQSISDGSPVLGDGRQTGTNVWTMQRSIQYVPRALSSSGVGTNAVFEADTYQQFELSLSHESVHLGYDPPAHDTSNYKFSVINTTGAELSFLYSATSWQANEGVTVPYTVLGGARVVLLASYVDGFMVITNVIQNTTTL